jgi:hypothetical protein
MLYQLSYSRTKPKSALSIPRGTKRIATAAVLDRTVGPFGPITRHIVAVCGHAAAESAAFAMRVCHRTVKRLRSRSSVSSS